ncbi:MAG: protein phosphatase 2C domain-containing protein [Pseudomonadota bacterium]
MRFAFDCGSATHVGRVRAHNEDGHLCDPEHGVWVVADGMGGEAAGDYASATVISALSTIGNAASAKDLLGRTQDRLGRAHRHLLDYAKRKRARVVGATVVVLLAYQQYVACIWSGDSRLYRLRDGRIAQLSRDHNEVGDLLSRGVINRDEARSWRGRNAVTRAVGVYDELETEILYGDLRPGDTFVLCSDGLTLHVADEEIRDVVRGYDVDEAADKLIELALQRGGEDNVTAIVVRSKLQSDDETTLEKPWRRSA